jgi:hypothetical protein
MRTATDERDMNAGLDALIDAECLGAVLLEFAGRCPVIASN